MIKAIYSTIIGFLTLLGLHHAQPLGQAVPPCAVKSISEAPYVQMINREEGYICIRFNNGGIFYKTKQDIQDAVTLYGGNGTPAARKTRTINGLIGELNAVSPCFQWNIDFDMSTGNALSISCTNA